MDRFDRILDSLDTGDRFDRVLDRVAAGEFDWQDVTPILQRRRKPGGGWEYRPNPARGEGIAPGVGVVGEDPKAKALREALSGEARVKEKPFDPLRDQLLPRAGAAAVSLPELPAAAADLLDKAMKRRPAPPGLSAAELFNPRPLYPGKAREAVESVYAKREDAAQDLARRMTEAGYSPEVSALADTGLELVAQTAGDVTNLVPGVGFVQWGQKTAPAPLPTRGRQTVARALGQEEIAAPGPSGRAAGLPEEGGVPRFGWREAMRQGSDFPADLDPWIRKQGLDPDRLPYPEKLDLYGRMLAEEKAKVDPRPDIVPDMEAKVFRVGEREFQTAWQAEAYRDTLDPETGLPPAPLSRERWEELRRTSPPPGSLAAGNPLVEAGRAKPSEMGALRLGPDPVKADPATEAFRSSVFEEAPAGRPVADRLREVKDKLLTEIFGSASHPYVSRMARAGARDAAEVNALELRRAGHTALHPITYATRRWDPATRQWEMTGEPLEAVFARMDEPARRQVEAVLAAETQAEFAGRYEKAKADYALARSQKRAERLALHEEGKKSRAAVRGIEAEARVLRAEEIKAARREGRAAGRAQALSPLAFRAQASGRKAEEALRDLVAAARDSEAAAEEAARLLVRERAWRDVAEQELRVGEKRFRKAGAPPPEAMGKRRELARSVEDAAYRSGVSDAALEAAYEAVTAGRRTRTAASGEIAQARARLAAAQAERTRLNTASGQAAVAARKKLDEVIRANRAEVQAAVARERQRAKIAKVERPADLDLDVDAARTAEARAYLAQMQASGDLAKLQPHLAAARDFMDRAFLQPLERLGVFSPAELAQIRAKNQHYSIIMRAEERIGQELRSGEAVATKTSPVGRRTAGLTEDGKYVPPLEAIAIQAARVDKFQVRQMVRNDLAERVLQSPDLWPELAPARVGEAGTFVFWKDGKQGAIKAPGDLLDVVDNIRPEQSGFVWRTARASAQMLRTLATLAPHFPGMNFLRDQATAAVFSQSNRLFGFIPYFSPAKELFKEIGGKLAGKGGSRAWKEFQASAAGHATFLRADREGFGRVLEEARLRATPEGRRALLAREAANPLFVPATMGNALESATRVAERELLLREGAGAREASLAAARVSLDFSDGGRFTKKVNEVVAFFNVRFLDPGRFLREIKRRPFTIAARATAFITLPALAEEWFHRDDPGYHDLPLWDQVAFYHVGRSTEGFAEGWYKRIPRPLGLVSYVFGLLPQLALRQAIKEDPHAADLAMRGLLQDTPAGLMFAQDEQGGLEPSMEAVPTIARGAAEIVANRKWTGAPVVPEDMRALPAGEQWDERTSPAVRELAHAMPGMTPDFLESPKQLEHLVSSQTAGTGRLALDILNPAVRAATGEAEPPREPPSPRDVPVLRNFMSPPPEGFQSLPAEDLYRFADRVDALADLARRQPERKAELRERYPEIRSAKAAAEAVKQMAEFRKVRDRLVASDLPDDLKRVRLRALDQRITAYAERKLARWRELYPDLLGGEAAPAPTPDRYEVILDQLQ